MQHPSLEHLQHKYASTSRESIFNGFYQKNLGWSLERAGTGFWEIEK